MSRIKKMGFAGDITSAPGVQIPPPDTFAYTHFWGVIRVSRNLDAVNFYHVLKSGFCQFAGFPNSFGNY